MSLVDEYPVAKKKQSKDAKKPESLQIAFRVPEPLYWRVVNAADALGLDSSGLLRMMLIECLPDYEARSNRTKAATD